LIVLVKVYELLDLSIVVVAVTLVYLLRSGLQSGFPKPRFDLLDLSVVLVALAEVISYATSTYPPNSIRWVSEALFLLLLYSLIRVAVVHDYQRVAIYLLITALAFWISSRALYSFWRHWGRLEAMGFTDPTDFRHLYGLVGPPGYATAERVTLFLLLLPFPLILFLTFKSFKEKLRPIRWLLLAPVITLVLALSVTFSRGVYVAICFFVAGASILLYRYRVASAGRIILFNLLLAIVVSLFLSPLARPVLTTVAMFRSPSQVRSFEGRIQLWRSSLELAGRHPWTGAGAFNFPIEYVADSEARPAFGASAFNYFLQILVEKGVVGLAAYLLLLFAFFRMSIIGSSMAQSRLHKTAAILFMIGVGAVIVRDLTYSSMFINKGANTLLWLMLAINARQLRGDRNDV
ncbi:MAG TPA: O-antigen ligase family protein, partial [Blastocatellia bacterium]|nr:O-antigen ligase family protein [Blastocatellia bacterium]